MANQYGELGIIYRDRGHWDKAEQSFLKSIEITEREGMLPVTANQYGNLGSVYQMQGDVERAIDCREKAINIFKKVGMQLQVDMVQGAIDKMKKKGKGKREGN